MGANSNFYKTRRPRFIKKIKKKWGCYVCQYCVTLINEKDVTVDHVIPLSKGGLCREKNYAISCHDCNQDKGIRLIKPELVL